MKTKTLKAMLAAMLLTLLGQSASANVISLNPQTQTVTLGAEISFDITIDFLQETVGGSLDIFYDSDFLSFQSIVVDDTFLNSVADPAFLVLPDNCLVDGAAIDGCSVGDAEINSFGFGSFDGIIGPHSVATLTFLAVSRGLATVGMADSDGPFGPFISAADASAMTVVYNGAAALVVPLPAALWLMLGATGLLGGLRRRE